MRVLPRAMSLVTQACPQPTPRILMTAIMCRAVLMVGLPSQLCPFTGGVHVMVSGCDPGEPGVAAEGMVDGADAVTAGAGEMGGGRMRRSLRRVLVVCQYPETVWCRFGLRSACSDALVVQWILKFFANSQICSALFFSHWGEREAEMVAFVPVLVSVGGECPHLTAVS